MGAEATDAKADNPGNEGPRELGNPLLLLLPGLPVDLSIEANSGRVPEY